MKKMKSLKQQMTTAFSLILVALAVAACAPEQAFAKDKGRTRANHINVVYVGGSTRFKAKRQKPNQQEFDRGYLSPNAANAYTGTTTVNQGRRNNITASPAGGNYSFNVQRRTVKPNHVVGDWDGDGVTTVGRRRNLIGSPEYFIRVDTSNMRDSSAKARVKQGH